MEEQQTFSERQARKFESRLISRRNKEGLLNGMQVPIPEIYLRNNSILCELLEQLLLSPKAVLELHRIGFAGEDACKSAGFTYWGPTAQFAANAEELQKQGYSIPEEPAGDVHWCPLGSNIPKFGGWQVSDGESLWNIPIDWIQKNS